jgi:RNA polymerase sigma-70 factor (ECF subfamily)
MHATVMTSQPPVAVGQLFELYGRRAYLTALGILRDEQEAQDATQESFVLAIRNIHRYDRARPFYPWLYRIVRNHCIDRIRRRREYATDPATFTLPDTDPKPDANLLQRETQTAVRVGIAKLSAAHQEILFLRHFQELSYPEIADALDIAEGTVMSRLYRARRALREAMLRHGWRNEEPEV